MMLPDDGDLEKPSRPEKEFVLMEDPLAIAACFFASSSLLDVKLPKSTKPPKDENLSSAFGLVGAAADSNPPKSDSCVGLVV